MQHTQMINKLVAEIIMKVALSCTAKVINSVAFYSEKNLIAVCFWGEKGKKEIVSVAYDDIWTPLVFNKITSSRIPTRVQICGIDIDNLPFNLNMPLVASS